jgi:hypothetical protein
METKILQIGYKKNDRDIGRDMQISAACPAS